MSIDQIASEALQLDPRDRATLAETIWESLEDPFEVPCDITDDEAINLAHRRDEEISNGKVSPVSHHDMMSRLRHEN